MVALSGLSADLIKGVAVSVGMPCTFIVSEGGPVFPNGDNPLIRYAYSFEISANVSVEYAYGDSFKVSFNIIAGSSEMGVKFLPSCDFSMM